MHFTIYKTTNKVNGKYYIGKHQTKNLEDGYIGSGKLLKRAIDKYGIENFTKEILNVFDNEEDMNQKEKELVVVSEDTYNLCDGGKGGFGYLNSHPNKKEWAKKGRTETNKILSKRISQKARQSYKQKYCVYCSEPIAFEKKRNNFCNHHCATTYQNTKNHWRSAN